MVKNFSGGNKSKGFARKNFIKKESGLRISQDEAEVYAQVTKVLGGSKCYVINLQGVQMICHIRGKFQGRGKRDNFIRNDTWLLVGMREWESQPLKGKLLNCDVIEVYNESDKIKLISNLTNINWKQFIINDTKSDEKEKESDFVFLDEKTEEYQELIKAQVNETSTSKQIINTYSCEINVDDI
jgi:translation initiation factor IF-1